MVRQQQRQQLPALLQPQRQEQPRSQWKRRAAWCLVALSCLNALRVHLLFPRHRHRYQKHQLQNPPQLSQPRQSQERQQQEQHERRQVLTVSSSDSMIIINKNEKNKLRHSESHGGDGGGDVRRHSRRRLLYIVTSLSEYDNGKRHTTKGNDRFSHTLLPVVQQSIGTIVETGLFDQVDLYLITHYTLSPQRLQQLQDALLSISTSSPSSSSGGGGGEQETVVIGYQVWDDATPLGYDVDDPISKKQHIIVPVLRALARQHRYVIKDKFFQYDVFCAFEDDMVVTGNHVRHFLQVTQQLYQLREIAPDTLPVEQVPTPNVAMQRYFGDMTKVQLERCLPGFIRVEAALPGFQPHQLNLVGIPIDYEWNDENNNMNKSDTRHINASVCCHLNEGWDWLPQQTPTRPSVNELYYWETSIEALSIRQLPSMKSITSSSTTSKSNENKGEVEEEQDEGPWVLLQGGNIDVLSLDPSYIMGGYWVGRAHASNTTIRYLANNDTTTAANGTSASGAGDGTGVGAVDPNTRRLYFENNPTRPDPTRGRYLNNQGGWMATRRQIRDWHFRHCPGGFLPPYDAPDFLQDGLVFKTVEYWSGGISIAGVNSCNLQRIIMLEPELFSHHLLYHVSNNKQKQPSVRYRFSSHTIDELWGQLNAVRKSAEQDKKRLAMENIDNNAATRQELERLQQHQKKKKAGFLFE